MMKQQQVDDFSSRFAPSVPTLNRKCRPKHVAQNVVSKLWIQLSKSARRVPLILLIAAVLGPLAQMTVAQQYQVTLLDSLGGTRSRGNSINNRQWIAGFSFVTANARRHAALWRDGSVKDLGTIGNPLLRHSNVAWPVKNNRGYLAGISQTDTPEPNGEVWSCAPFLGFQTGFTCLGFRWKDDVMTRLLPLPGGNNSFATGADNLGRVVGWAENGVHDTENCEAPQVLQFHPVTWGPGTDQPQALPLFPGDSSGAATAINNKGQIVGISGICDQAVGRRTAKHALLWAGNTVTNLGNLGAELWITPMAINQNGDVAGFGATSADDLPGNFLRAFFWNQKSGMTRIDPLPGLNHVLTQGHGLNSQGQVVGLSCTLEGDCLGFMWQNGVMTNLADPNVVPGFTGVIINAMDINDDGEITGRAFDPDTGDIKTFIAVPILETATAKNKSPLKAQAKVTLPEHVRRIMRQQRGIASISQ